MFACNEQYFNQIFVFESTPKKIFSSKRSEYYSNLKHTKASDFSLNHLELDHNLCIIQIAGI